MVDDNNKEDTVIENNNTNEVDRIEEISIDSQSVIDAMNSFNNMYIFGDNLYK